MARRKLSSEKGITMKVHPRFKELILDPMDREVERKLGAFIILDNPQKTRILTDELIKQRFTFMIPKDEKGKRRKPNEVL